PPLTALSADEIAVIRQWIDQGAQGSGADRSSATPAPAPVAAATSYPGGYKERVITDQDRQWWAFKPPVRAAVPAVKDTRWSRNPIDGFVRAALDAKGLEVAPQADKRTLIRRVYLDLVGLLPPPAEVDAFVKDTAPDAYEKLVDRLLASPNYG